MPDFSLIGGVRGGVGGLGVARVVGWVGFGGCGAIWGVGCLFRGQSVAGYFGLAVFFVWGGALGYRSMGFGHFDNAS